MWSCDGLPQSAAGRPRAATEIEYFVRMPAATLFLYVGYVVTVVHWDVAAENSNGYLSSICRIQ